MNASKRRRTGCLFLFFLFACPIIVLPCLFVRRELRRELLSAQLMVTVKRVLGRSETYIGI